jgi:glycine/D-amino acid oxidase-like deaminating enzyme/nitrite reductase/ring-hydroxylating ferredoxin subunit
LDTASNEIRSPWLSAPAPEPRGGLSEDIEVDVAVLGGGIVGVSTAFRLTEAGRSVALIEARTLASGVTGNSTAKLSALQGAVYSQIEGRHGVEASRAYAELNRAGVEDAFALAERLSVECRIARRPAYTYTERESGRGDIEAEAEAATTAGLDVTVTEETDLPFEVAAAVRLDDQGQFDPVAWTRGLAAAAAAEGALVFEGTRANDVRGREGELRVGTTAGAELRCGHVVVATHMPFLDRGLYFARLRPERSYAVAGPANGAAPQGMYLSAEKPARSIRSFADLGGTTHVIVGGEGHKAGQSEPGDRYRRLEGELAERFDVDRVDYRWAAHDLLSADLLPFVGRLSPLDERILTATGFNKWGLAAGVGAASILRDIVLGRDNALAERFDPARLNLRAALPSIVREGADFSLHFALDRLRRPRDGEPAPGEGVIAGSGLEQHAVHRDDQGTLHRLSARCTHLGCIVAWNAAEHTWDCPCHGSRFAATGEVIQGPAVSPLAPKD